MMKLLSVLVLSLMSFATLANTSLPNNRHIVVTGNAELQVKPDIAIVSLHVKAIKLKSIDAKSDIDKRVNQFLAGLFHFNIDENNVSASNLSTKQDYSYHNGKKSNNGFTAERTLKVTLNDMTKLNELMNFALTTGINSITSINFASSMAEKYQDEVNALAVENAKSKAKSLANAFGAKLGGIYSINSNGYSLRNRLGRNANIESITAANFGSLPNGVEGKYLEENIVFSSSINTVFDIELR